MAWLFASGHVADLVLIVLAAEAALLWAWRRRMGGGPGSILGIVLPGVALVLALRLALTDAWWGWIGLVLGLALLAHLFDLAQRWRG
jgi:hypothetical protein